SLFISYLSLNNNFLQIPGAFFKPSGVTWRYAALPPAVRPMTLHPRFSNGRRLRLLVLVSPASAWSNSRWLLDVPPWVRWSSPHHHLRFCFCSGDRRCFASAVLLLSDDNRALHHPHLSSDSQRPAWT